MHVIFELPKITVDHLQIHDQQIAVHHPEMVSYLFIFNEVVMAERFKTGGDEYVYKQNRKIVINNSTTCAICGGELDKSLRWPHPMSVTVDHIIPVSKGGSTTDITNMCAAHFICNRLKSNKVMDLSISRKKRDVGMRDLPHMRDWTTYRASK